MKTGISASIAAACAVALACSAHATDLPPPGTLTEACYGTAEQAADAAMQATYAFGDDLLFSGTVQRTGPDCYRYSLPLAQVTEGHMFFPPASDGRTLVAVYFTTREALGPALRRVQQKIADGLQVQVYLGLASTRVTESAKPSGT